MKNFCKLFGIVAIITIIGFSTITCNNGGDNGDDRDNEYPYTKHGIWYMGFKSGLFAWSSDQEFDDALNEVWQNYSKDNPSTVDNKAVFNDVSYDIINWESVTGKVPRYVWDTFYSDLYKNNYPIGSCWLFNYVEIPSKKGTGTIIAIDTIVRNSNGGVRYWASKATLKPKDSRSILNLKQANETPYLLHGKNSNAMEYMASDGQP